MLWHLLHVNICIADHTLQMIPDFISYIPSLRVAPAEVARDCFVSHERSKGTLNLVSPSGLLHGDTTLSPHYDLFLVVFFFTSDQ